MRGGLALTLGNAIVYGQNCLAFGQIGFARNGGRISCGCFLMTWQWTFSPRIAGKANDSELWESRETDTLSYPVAHSSF
jgi:hypothetical protein